MTEPKLAKPTTVEVEYFATNKVQVEIVQTHAGEYLDYRGKRSWGEPRRIIVGKLWDVFLDGNILGRVRYVMITRETRTPGRRYVNSRWQSPGWQYRVGGGFGSGRWFEGYTKTEAIERVVREATSPRTF